MATIDRTPNGGTVGHPANVARPYVVTSKVHDALQMVVQVETSFN